MTVEFVETEPCAPTLVRISLFSSLRDLTTGPVTMARKAFRGHGVAGDVLSLSRYSLGETLGIPIAKKATERCAWLTQEKERRAGCQCDVL